MNYHNSTLDESPLELEVKDIEVAEHSSLEPLTIYTGQQLNYLNFRIPFVMAPKTYNGVIPELEPSFAFIEGNGERYIAYPLGKIVQLGKKNEERTHLESLRDTWYFIERKL